MKRFIAMLMAGLLAVAIAVPAQAWEVDLKGLYLQGWDYFDQLGTEGFFGTRNPTTFSTGPGPNYSGMNTWVGARQINGTQYGLVTASDAALNWSRMELYPEIRLHPAIRFRGQYSIGATLTGTGPFAGYGLYANSSNFGSYNPMAFGQWDQWWVTAQMPIGILVVGKRPGGFGIGAQYEPTMAQSESLAIVAPYGPLRIGWYCYPWREARWLNPRMNALVSPAIAGSSNSRRNVASVTSANPYQTGTVTVQPWDDVQIRNFQPGVFFTYSNGPIEVGALYEWWTQHFSPAEASSRDLAQLLATVDQVAEDGTAYMKYSNGNFFFGAELAWLRAGVTYSPPAFPGGSNGAFGAPLVDPGDGGGSEYAPWNAEIWKFMAEAGVFAGPAKVSLFYSWVPGPDRRNGIWIGKQSWETIAGGRFLGNTQAFLPYSLLMSYQYAGGLNTINQRGEGYMSDAQSIGARIDYSVAANLNVYLSGFYANRLSHGWGWGSLIPLQSGTFKGVHVLGSFDPTGVYGAAATATAPNASFINTFLTGAPSIPNNFLGWEATAGVDWKLLEGLTLKMRGAYWQPGDWFKFACVDRSSVAYLNGTSAGFATPLAGSGPWGWGINPTKGIDAIFGFQAVMAVDF